MNAGVSTVVIPSPSRQYANVAEWVSALGDIPLERIRLDPLPGRATEADLLRCVERDDRLCELIDCTLVEKPLGYWEALIAMRIGALLTAYADKLGLGAVSGADSTLRMKFGNIRLPDVAFVSMARLPKTREPVPTLAPDLAIEVLSESNTAREMDKKLVEYFQSGTNLAWIVDPSTRTASIYHSAKEPSQILKEEDFLDGEEVLPGLKISIAELSRNIPR